VTDPAVSVPINPDSAASAGRNLEVLRGLSELELLKLLGQLQEQGSAPVLPPTSGAPEEVGRSTSFQTSRVPVTGNTIRLDIAPPPGFQPRLIVHQESTSGFSPARDTGNGVISGLPPRGTLPVPPSLFSKGKEAGSHPQIPFPVRRPDTGYGIPARRKRKT
jgi:hypothetical protein